MALDDHDYGEALKVWDDAAALLTMLGSRVSRADYIHVEGVYARLVENRGILVRAAAERNAMLLLSGRGHDV